MTTIHLIGNAHIDPVWLWDWREGMNEALATCRAMVNLAEEFPAFRFIRGEAAIYEHVQRHDPATFSAIRRLIRSGRWDVVGGTYIQPDTNLPSTSQLLDQFIRGKRYFRETFGREVTVAWAADSFGHSAGLPDILAAAGIDSFAFTRPQAQILPLEKQAFWWKGAGGKRILAFRPKDGWYSSERDDLEKRLDACRRSAEEEGLENVAFFYGLGNHGGGPALKVEHSGLHRFFAVLREECERRGPTHLPEHHGELNFCLRGCSASVAKFKFAYRQAEANWERAARAAAVVEHVWPQRDSVRDTLLFNAFHDILPGSSIERAFDDQLAQIGGVLHQTQRAETTALLQLSAQIDTTVPAPQGDAPGAVPILLWNPHPWKVSAQVEMEVSLDYRPLWRYRDRENEVPVWVRDANGRALPFQTIATEHDSFAGIPWRRRVLAPVSLPPLGWQVVTVGLEGKATTLSRPPGVWAKGHTRITNKQFAITALPGQAAVRFWRGGRSWLGAGLQVRTYEDPWGSWGGMNEEEDSWSLKRERERWTIADTRVLENGPERAALWVRFSGKKSRVDLTFYLSREVDHVEVRGRVFSDERSSRLKLIFPAAAMEAEFEVPGGVCRRQPCGEVPGGRWVRTGSGSGAVGLASDALYGFETTPTELRATIMRATRYASDQAKQPADEPWIPATDAGELRFQLILTPNVRDLPRLAAQLEMPISVLAVPARPGKLAREGGFGGRLPAEIKLLSLAGSSSSLELRLHNTSSGPRKVSWRWQDSRLALGNMRGGEIAAWSLVRRGARWIATRCEDATSLP